MTIEEALTAPSSTDELNRQIRYLNNIVKRRLNNIKESGEFSYAAKEFGRIRKVDRLSKWTIADRKAYLQKLQVFTKSKTKLAEVQKINKQYSRITKGLSTNKQKKLFFNAIHKYREQGIRYNHALSDIRRNIKSRAGSDESRSDIMEKYKIKDTSGGYDYQMLTEEGKAYVDGLVAIERHNERERKKLDKISNYS